jgi:hypothetical protein
VVGVAKDSRLEVVCHSDQRKLDRLNTIPRGARLLRRGLVPS